MSEPEPTVTAFTVGRVAAALQHDRWTFTWPGRNTDDRAAIPVTYPAAVQLAAQLDGMLDDLEPHRHKYETGRAAIRDWLIRQSQTAAADRGDQ